MSVEDLKQRLAERHLLGDVERIARDHHVTVDDMLRGSRGKTVWVHTRARDAAMAHFRRELDMSTPDIGRLFGRHHTTVVRALERVRGRESLAEVMAR